MKNQALISFFLILLSCLTPNLQAQETHEHSVTQTCDNPGAFIRNEFYHSEGTGFCRQWETRSDPMIRIFTSTAAFTSADNSVWTWKKDQCFTATIYDLNYALSGMRFVFHNRTADGTGDNAFAYGNDTVRACGTDTATLVIDLHDSPVRNYDFYKLGADLNVGAIMDTVTFFYVDNPRKGQDSIQWVIANDEWRIKDYHAGTEPGCFPAENITAVETAWQRMAAISDEATIADAEKLRLFREYKSSLRKLRESQVKVPVPTGYYYVVNQLSKERSESSIDPLEPMYFLQDSLSNLVTKSGMLPADGQVEVNSLWYVENTNDDYLELCHVKSNSYIWSSGSIRQYYHLSEDREISKVFKKIESAPFPGYVYLRDTTIHLNPIGGEEAGEMFFDVVQDYNELFDRSYLISDIKLCYSYRIEGPDFYASREVDINGAWKFIPVDKSIIEALGIDAVMTDSAKSPEQIHSLDGRRLQRLPEKGVYIVNGRKVVRK